MKYISGNEKKKIVLRLATTVFGCLVTGATLGGIKYYSDKSDVMNYQSGSKQDVQDAETNIREKIFSKQGYLAEYIFNYLIDKGVPEIGAAAIVGNVYVESGFKADCVNTIGCSGLCQWYQGRLDGLKKFAENKGKDWTDVECQLDYMWEELNTKYPKVKEVIMNTDQASELEYATWCLSRYYLMSLANDSFEESKNITAKRYESAQYWYQEWKQQHTSLVKNTLEYACSWEGKIPYKSVVNGYSDNEEIFLPLQEGRASDSAHFVHRVFGHVGLMEDTTEYFAKYGHLSTWGNGGDAGGCPGTVKIGTDLSKASPGDVLWWDYGDGHYHVAIYLGNGKMIECTYTGNGIGGVVISTVTQGSEISQILHFEEMPYNPDGYYDSKTNILYDSIDNTIVQKEKGIPNSTYDEIIEEFVIGEDGDIEDIRDSGSDISETEENIR